MTKEEKEQLVKISTEGFKCRTMLREYLSDVETAPEASFKPKKRTSAQHRALFLWYSQIEKVSEVAGVTWDRIIKHTHQIRVTQENVHEAGKQLQKALWNKSSTKDLETHQLDILIDHFVDLFSKEGVELPPFPSEDSNTRLDAMENLKKEYPEHTPPTI